VKAAARKICGMTSEHTAAPVHLTPELVEDPVGAYAEFRAQDRLPQVVLPGLTTPARLVTRYADVKAALAEPRLIRDRSKVPGGAGGGSASTRRTGTGCARGSATSRTATAAGWPTGSWASWTMSKT
jgi:cytochrome P450